MGTLLACLAILAVAAFAQAVSGFGFALASVPLLSLVVGPAAAVVTATLASTLMCATVMAAQRRHVDWRISALLTLPALLGMPLGLLCLKYLPDKWLRAVIAVVLVFCLIMVWRGWRMTYAAWRVGLAGAVSGVLLTATGTNGPPLVAAVHALGVPPERFRATLAATFTFTGTLGFAGFVGSGLVSVRALLLCGVGMVAVGVGALAGQKLVVRIDSVLFRRIVLFMLAGCATAAVVNVAL